MNLARLGIKEGHQMVERARSMIRYYLREVPDMEVRFTEAIAEDSFVVKNDPGVRILFLHPGHEEFVDALRSCA